MAPGLISIKYGFRGANFSISSACASGLHAIISAAHEIMLGKLDAVVTGGSESPISEVSLTGFSNMRALSKSNDLVERASRPFHRDRDGFIASEGSAILILENFEKAKARGAKIFATIEGTGATSDAYHITHPMENGEGALLAMKSAIESAGINLKEVDYINAHATGTTTGDIAETRAIKSLFNDHAYKLKISATKSSTGHLLGAAGAIESIWCIKAMTDGILPATINLDATDPECDLDYIPNRPERREIEFALNNSFGFGGTNGSLLLKKYKG
jgi:3-oxoacyl-[acyl-carrier-protein] synthase II